MIFLLSPFHTVEDFGRLEAALRAMPAFRNGGILRRGGIALPLSETVDRPALERALSPPPGLAAPDGNGARAAGCGTRRRPGRVPLSSGSGRRGPR